MNAAKQLFIQFLKLLLFWILIFDFQRILFSIHNWSKFQEVTWSDFLLTFVYSIRLDLSTAAYLSLIPLLFLLVRNLHPGKWSNRIFYGVLFVEVLFISMIHAGEINAYPEWNHKLTSRVFMHLSNPDEVMRTADYGMIFWFAVYTLLEVVFAYRLRQWLFDFSSESNPTVWYVKYPLAVGLFGVFGLGLFLTARGGWQQIPINIDSAYFSNHHLANDLAVNSTYYFGNSYLLYNRADIDEFMPDINKEKAVQMVNEWYNYPKNHDNFIFKDQRPNFVFVILESWGAEAIGCLSEKNKGATDHFDALAEEGLLFTNLYATGHTSEIGNSSIFSGNPAIPEISISLQPEKHRKLPSLNQDLQQWGYSSHYIFSGDLKYGNIGGYFMDHGFQDVADENDFPTHLPRGKLNYYDEDLYRILLERINKTKGKFMHCAFTGSTHSPYDYPQQTTRKWTGEEADFMNSVVYADKSIHAFIEESKQYEWFDNTVFVFVADHGHGAPGTTNPGTNAFYRIPLLIWGEPLKDEYRGKRIDKLGSQIDIAATLLYQMGGKSDHYRWSKDLLNPHAPEFAFHTVINGYGWITPKGAFTYLMKYKAFTSNTYSENEFEGELFNAHAYLTAIYDDYKNL